jgi:hypothetical protein
MIKVAALTLDVYDDTDLVVARQLPTELHALPVATHAEIDELPDRQFGLVMKTAGDALRRRFPLHTPEACKLSSAYFERTKDRLPPEAAAVAAAKIAAASKLHEHKDILTPEESDVLAKVAYVDITALKPRAQKVAFAAQHWGLTIGGKNCFPLHDAALVKTAIARFAETASQLEPEERFVYARSIAGRAVAEKVAIAGESQINLYTNDRPNLQALKIAIARRKQAVGAKVATLVLDQLEQAAGCWLERGDIETEASFALRQTKQAAMLKATQGVNAEQAISVLSTFDKLAGIGRHEYVRGLPDPFASLFKKADADASATMVDGVDLGVLSPEMLSRDFDEGFITDFFQNPVQVYMSLPDPVKAIIRDRADAVMHGSSPDAQKGTVESGCRPEDATTGDAGDPKVQLAAQYSNEPASIVY